MEVASITKHQFHEEAGTCNSKLASCAKKDNKYYIFKICNTGLKYPRAVGYSKREGPLKSKVYF